VFCRVLGGGAENTVLLLNMYSSSQSKTEPLTNDIKRAPNTLRAHISNTTTVPQLSSTYNTTTFFIERHVNNGRCHQPANRDTNIRNANTVILHKKHPNGNDTSDHEGTQTHKQHNNINTCKHNILGWST